MANEVLNKKLDVLRIPVSDSNTFRDLGLGKPKHFVVHNYS